LHYRDDPEYWDKWFPADFITESFPGQFRNWFYSLLAQSTALTNRPPFLNIFGFALILAEDGREMHKSWGNAIEFNEAADIIGADTMRWMFAHHKPEQNLLFGMNSGDETRRRFLIPLWNVYSFLVTYARIDHWVPDSDGASSNGDPSPNSANAQMDEWILARLDEVTTKTSEALESFRAEKATVFLEAFLDDLSNWYVRRSRRRFWKSETDADKSAAYATLYSVMVRFSKLLAPFIPFTAEAIYQNLVRGIDAAAPMSVHHCEWPVTDADALDRPLLKKMRLAIVVASLGRSARGSVDIKLRQPLARARVHVGSQRERDDLIALVDILTEEINVKEIDIASEVGELVKYRLLPNNRVLGPRFGSAFPKVRQSLAEVDPLFAARELQSGRSLVLEVDGEPVELDSEDVIIQTESRGGLAVASDKGITVAVDTTLTQTLKQEGIARDLVRRVNTMRKEARLALDDRIDLAYVAEGIVVRAIENYAEYICQETLAVSLMPGEIENADYRQTEIIDENHVSLSLRKA
jgi:isoleucyl-tRNA synthetase